MLHALSLSLSATAAARRRSGRRGGDGLDGGGGHRRGATGERLVPRVGDRRGEHVGRFDVDGARRGASRHRRERLTRSSGLQAGPTKGARALRAHVAEDEADIVDPTELQVLKRADQK